MLHHPRQVSHSDHLETCYENVLRGAGNAVCVGGGIGDQVCAVLFALEGRRLNAGYYLIVATLTVLAHFADLGVDEPMSTLHAEEAKDCNQRQSPCCHNNAARRGQLLAGGTTLVAAPSSTSSDVPIDVCNNTQTKSQGNAWLLNAWSPQSDRSRSAIGR